MTTMPIRSLINAEQVPYADIEPHVGHEVEVTWIRGGVPVITTGTLTSATVWNIIVKSGAQVQHIDAAKTRTIKCRKPSAHRRK